jgi:hypothetical protein
VVWFLETPRKFDVRVRTFDFLIDSKPHSNKSPLYFVRALFEGSLVNSRRTLVRVYVAA